MRRTAVLLAVVLTAACGTRVRVVESAPTSQPPTPTVSASPGVSPTASPVPSATATPNAASTAPLALVGWWRLTYPAHGWSVGFGDEMTIVLPCGELEADWQASPSGLFAAAETGGDGSCLEKPPRPDISWYKTPRSFTVGDELVLRAPDGSVSARMVRTSVPPGQKALTVSAQRRARLGAPAPLPRGVDPAARSSLQGRWVAHGADAGNGRGYVAFGTGWTWSGSDGCNGDGGSFSIGPAGDFLTTDGPHTAIGCDMTPGPSWVHDARRLGLSAGALVLVDVRGKVLGRLWRS